MRYDAIIIGGGPAGAATALAMARLGRVVAVVERHAFPRRKVCGEFISAVNLPLLDDLGLGPAFRAVAGPEVRRLALFGAGPAIAGTMPAAAKGGFGRALGRDVLDGMLLDAAREAGARVFQPWRATNIARDPEGFRLCIEAEESTRVLSCSVLVAAHGSWEPGHLQTNLEKRNRPSDFLGFKAHFTGAAMARDLMPLLAFPGGYGGMVWTDKGRLSLSCCIRRDRLEDIRSTRSDISAGAAVLAHILASCPAAREALAGSSIEGEWLGAGPIRPGIRAAFRDGVFRAGNIAGESHPIIAEGISMALQSGCLLAAKLEGFDQWTMQAQKAAGHHYASAWRRQFVLRIRVAALLSVMASSPAGAALMGMVAARAPSVLALGARLSGKVKPLALPKPYIF